MLMLSKAIFMPKREKFEQTTEEKGKQRIWWQQGDKKNCLLLVPRAATAYGLQLKIIPVWCMDRTWNTKYVMF